MCPIDALADSFLIAMVGTRSVGVTLKMVIMAVLVVNLNLKKIILALTKPSFMIKYY